MSNNNSSDNKCVRVFCFVCQILVVKRNYKASLFDTSKSIINNFGVLCFPDAAKLFAGRKVLLSDTRLNRTQFANLW